MDPSDITIHPSSGGTIRSRSVAEMVATVLRERIIKNDLTDGDLLPKQEELLAELGVSKPSIQAALRILEAEGLIRVRRGKKGGAVVHRPRVANAASVIEMVLRTRCVPTEDLSAALRNLEPVCAKLCASREDRETSVLPRLQAAQARAHDDLDDIVRFTESCRAFHKELVACCGNETVILIIWGAGSRLVGSRQRVGRRAQDVGGLSTGQSLISRAGAGRPRPPHQIDRPRRRGWSHAGSPTPPGLVRPYLPGAPRRHDRPAPARRDPPYRPGQRSAKLTPESAI